VAKRWYDTEYGVNGADYWYKHAMEVTEDLYGRIARQQG
jgi:hypothetical protein